MRTVIIALVLAGCGKAPDRSAELLADQCRELRTQLGLLRTLADADPAGTRTGLTFAIGYMHSCGVSAKAIRLANAATLSSDLALLKIAIDAALPEVAP